MSNSRPKPIDQGFLREIARVFILPLLRQKPEGILATKFLADDVFHTHERDIKKYECTRAFDMPGKVWITPTTFMEGIGKRSIRVRDRMLVRTDTTMPDRIDIELTLGGRHVRHLYALTQKDWNKIKGCVKDINYRRGERKGVSVNDLFIQLNQMEDQETGNRNYMRMHSAISFIVGCLDALPKELQPIIQTQLFDLLSGSDLKTVMSDDYLNDYFK